MALFIDMTKAFDMVDHKLLLEKLFNAGFRGIIYKWFESYLMDREQRVIVNGKFSNSLKLKNGVPQGSVLGPILFLVYINSLLKQKFIGSPIAFADDIAFIYTDNSSFECIANIDEDLQTLRHWFALHKLIISEKTKMMYFKLSGDIPTDFGVFFPFSRL